MDDGVKSDLADDVGCVDRSHTSIIKNWNAAAFLCGINPIIPLVSTAWNNRDHRKVVVIDGHTAYLPEGLIWQMSISTGRNASVIEDVTKVIGDAVNLSDASRSGNATGRPMRLRHTAPRPP